MKKNISKKDLAFDMERQGFRKKINDLERVIKQKDSSIRELKLAVMTADEKNDELRSWVDRLLEYCDLNEDELKSIIEHDKNMANISSNLGSLTSIFGNGFMRGWTGL